MRRITGFLLFFVLCIPGANAMDDGTLPFDTFFEKHSSPMWMIDVKTGAIVRANDAAENFYGYEQLEGMNINEINMLTPEQISNERRRASKADRNHLFFRHRLGDGRVKLMGVYTDAFELNGREVLLSILYDTSDFDPAAERHYIDRVQEQVDIQTAELRAAQSSQFWLAVVGGSVQAVIIIILLVVLLRLRSSNQENRRLLDELSFRNQELERLGHVMAHHFQEPSRRLVSFAQQASRALGDEPDGTLSVSVEFIQQQAKRLSNLVSDVQRYLSLDHLPPKMESINANNLLNKVYHKDPALAELYQEQALEVPSRLPDVYFDARRLELIFHVLLHNAWMYRHPSRPLCVQVIAEPFGDHIRFCVMDNGSGIDPEYRNQVLELFSRLVPNTNTLPGTGMGLALVVKALRPANGQLWIEDGMEGGTAVIFELPANRYLNP